MQNKKTLLKTLTVGIIGNILEWYDLTIYGYLSPIIAQLFFPSGHPFISLVSTLGIFAIGFLIRPLGSCFFGSLGDRFGRKSALFSSLLLMTGATLMIGLIPTYERIGIWAPILLTIFRLMQGFSVGGEWTSSILFLTEHASSNRKGFAGSWVYFGSGIGWLLGSFVCAQVTGSLANDALLSWGWRLPFLIGVLTGLFGLFIRFYSDETEHFLSLKASKGISECPIRETACGFKSQVALTIGLGVFSNTGGYIVYAYIPTYLNRHASVPLGEALTITTLSLGLFTILVPFAGWLSDYLGRRHLFLLSVLGMIACAIPLFTLLREGDYIQKLTAISILTVFMALFQGPFPAQMHDLFPTRIRSTGVAISYNTSAALFAGTTPLVCTLLISLTDNILAPAYYLICASAITLGTLLFVKEQASVPAVD